jgi:lipopolysaccharide exporter
VNDPNVIDPSLPSHRLSKLVIKAGFWGFFLKFCQQSFDFVRVILLAHFLAPSDFGMMGIALLTLATLETFSFIGLQQALVQRARITESHLNTAWTLSIVRGVFIFMFLYALAPASAAFFKTPEAEMIIKIMGFAVILQSLTNIGVVTFQKDLEFNKEFIYQFSNTLATFVVSIVALFILRSVWAMVWGVLAGNAARLVASYLIHPYRPRIHFDPQNAGELFRFGRWLLISSIVIFLFSQGDDIFVGKMLGVSLLGFYQLAYKISNIATSEIAGVIRQITFPVYAKMENRIDSLKNGYLKVLQTTLLMSLPITVLIFVLAPEFTKIFLSLKWLPIVPIMRILVFFGLLRAIGATSGVLFCGIGKPYVVMRWEIVRLGVLATAIFPLTHQYGIAGVAYAVLLSQAVMSFNLCYKAGKTTKCGTIEQIKQSILPLACTVIMMSVLFTLKALLQAELIWTFATFAMTSVIAYLGSLYALDRFFKCGVCSLVLENLHFLKFEGIHRKA